MGLGELTRQASFILHEKYKVAKRVLNDVSHAELMAEEATNGEPLSPNAPTMARISEASFEFDDYWRIVDILHRRLHCVDFKEWRQSYKALVLLEFLLTHGPEDFAEEFYCDVDVIQELGTFQYVDDKGFDWGSSMLKKSKRIANLLSNGHFLSDAREKALKLSREIKGFGSSDVPPNSPTLSSPSSSSSPSPSFKSPSPHPFAWDEEQRKHDHVNNRDEEKEIPHGWNDSGSPLHERGSLLNPNCNANANVIMRAKEGFRSLSQVGKLMRKTFQRQLSLGF